MEQQGMYIVKLSVLVTLSLVVSACNQSNVEEPTSTDALGSELCEKALKDVIRSEFTGPDYEVRRLKQEFGDMVRDFNEQTGGRVDHPGYMEGGPEVDALFAYMDETYASYFTEKGYAEFTQVEIPKAFAYHETILEYWIEPTGIYVNKVEIEDTNQEFSAFDFTADVDYSTRREGGSYEFTGWALCSPEGKISHLTILDLDGLAARIEQDRY